MSEKRKQPESGSICFAAKRFSDSTNAAFAEESSDADSRRKRLQKNRQAAQQFRQRQRDHIVQLEEKVRELEQQNKKLEDAASGLELENEKMKIQLSNIQSFIASSVNQIQTNQQLNPQSNPSPEPRPQ